MTRLPAGYRILVIAAGASAVLACRGAEQVDPTPAPPNVVLIVLDTVRFDALSCYGNPRSTTPHIDRLARDGTRFENAYATCFWTLPSHASLLTGLYPSAAGATSETNHLPAAITTVAERFADAGFRTGAVVRNAWLSAERGFDQGFDDYFEEWRDDAGSETDEERAAAGRAAEWIAARVGAGERWFLFLNLNVAHLPYTPPEPWRSRFASRSWSEDRVDRLVKIEGGWGHLAGALILDEDDYRVLRDLYEAEVAFADQLVGELVDRISELGVLDDTLVVVTSDHGENIGDHGMIDHVFSLYDTTLRVPLVVRYPARFDAGRVVEELVSLIDVAPTLAALCGVCDSAEFEGLTLDNLAGSSRAAVYAENSRPINGVRLLRRWFPDFDAAAIDHQMRMVRTGRFKLVWKADVAAELFDLEADPSELVDATPAHPDLRNRLLADLRAWVLGVEPRTAATPFESRDRESLDRLRALGYVE